MVENNHRGETSIKAGQTSAVALQKKEREAEEGKKNITSLKKPRLKGEQRRVYRQALQALNETGVVFAVGSAFARHAYTNIWRETKDIDIFLKPVELKKALDTLQAAGFQTEIRDRRWLAKAWKGDYFIDLIFGTGNGQIPITDDTFRGSKCGKLLGIEVNLMPVEEMIASAAYVAVRDRFDGSEILHLIRTKRGRIDWQRILDRLGENRQLLLWHLILFDFVYPGLSNYLPKELMNQLIEEMRRRWKSKSSNKKAFRGSILDPFSYVVDIQDWGYEDRRIMDPLVDQNGVAL